jgi:hypothetical protein
MSETSASVPDIGRSLRLAREKARLSLDEAAARAGIDGTEAELLESGTVARLRDRVETLRSLRLYAESLGLPGKDYALAYIELWPARGPDSGQVPVVSVTSAPAGGHSVAGGNTGWPLDRTGAADFSITGVVSPIGPLSHHDTGVVPAYETGQVPAVRQSAPRYLKVLVAIVALLVAAGAFTLTEHNNISKWNRSLRADTTRWFDDVKSAAGFTSASTKGAHHHATTATATKTTALPKVTYVRNVPAGRVTINVHAASFGFKVVAYQAPTWLKVTAAGHPAPLYEQVLPANQNYIDLVSHSATVELGASAGRLFVYDGLRLLTYYFPSKTPFTITLNAVG